MKYFLVLCNRFKTFKNLDKNPDLLMDLKIATENQKSTTIVKCLFSTMKPRTLGKKFIGKK